MTLGPAAIVAVVLMHYSTGINITSANLRPGARRQRTRGQEDDVSLAAVAFLTHQLIVEHDVGAALRFGNDVVLGHQNFNTVFPQGIEIEVPLGIGHGFDGERVSAAHTFRFLRNPTYGALQSEIDPLETTLDTSQLRRLRHQTIAMGTEGNNSGARYLNRATDE